jgi:hypothetical protein
MTKAAMTTFLRHSSLFVKMPNSNTNPAQLMGLIKKNSIFER